MTYLVIDLETVADPAWSPPDDKPSMLPPAWACRVVCAGWVRLDGDLRLIDHGVDQGDERRLLWAFSASVEGFYKFARKFNQQATVVTYNGRGFDIPVLLARALALGVPMSWMFGREFVKRYSDREHLDLADAVTLNGAGRMMKLDDLARAMGLAGKDGTTGADVAALHAAGEHDKIARYCLGDCFITAQLLLRYKFVRGEITYATLTSRRDALDDASKEIR